MGKYFHAFILICSGSCFIISPLMAGDLRNDVVVAREDTSVILSCFDSPPTSSVMVTWKMMTTREDRWTYLLSAKCTDGQTDGSSIESGGRTFEISADASLIFRATAAAQGHYACEIKQDDKKLHERVVLLALIKLTVTPTPPVTVDSTLRLAAQVSPSSVAAWGTWVSPSGEQLHTEISYGTGSLLSKLPRVTSKDNGVYTCRIRVSGNSDRSVSEHRVNVTVNGVERSLAALSHSLVTLTCPSVLGDYVLVYWVKADTEIMELIFQFDRWRRSYTNQTKPQLRLIDPASLAAAGNFSFLLRPTRMDGGLYLCEVFLDDKVFSQANRLSVLHGYPKSSRTTLDLSCVYSERSQVKNVTWSYVKNSTRSLRSRRVVGRITTSVALPVTPERAGEYACTLYLENGNSVQYTYTVTMTNIEPTISPGSALPPAVFLTLPPADDSLHPYVSTFSFLLFLIPLIAVAVGVLLWRQGFCVTRRSKAPFLSFPPESVHQRSEGCQFTQADVDGQNKPHWIKCDMKPSCVCVHVDVKQSQSHHSREVENIYENPDDLRQQTPPQGAVYMDLKPMGETDVYKELDRYNQCSG
ncbi:g6f-like isoform X5 [Carassius gibelio]|uniref:g6f-like isoform X5 n=1 Tax=Carassius gibelio TaxID=101364 RepID=UPI002278052A|nr:g6f-like isoform X5 [Carassius gibelio]